MTKPTAADKTISAAATREYSQSEAAAPDALDANGAPSDLEEWDDTPTALGLRALFTFLTGAFLIFSMTRAPLSSCEPMRLAQSYLLAFLVLPLGVVWLFFAQSVRHIDYLKNQALNAWNYGWNFRSARDEEAPSSLPSRVRASPLLMGIALCVVVVPLLLFAARESGADSAIFPLNASTRAWWLPLALLIAFCREWFFRGFLLFGIAQGFRGVAAPIIAIVIQAALFVAALGASNGGAFFDVANVALFFAGVLCGAVAWRQKSFVAPFVAHAMALCTAALLA